MQCRGLADPYHSLGILNWGAGFFAWFCTGLKVLILVFLLRCRGKRFHVFGANDGNGWEEYVFLWQNWKWTAVNMSLFYFGRLSNWERLCTLGKGTLGRVCDTSWKGGRDYSPGFPWVSQFVYLADCPWLWVRGNDGSLLVPLLPSLTELGMVAGCCHLLFDRLSVEPHRPQQALSDSEHLDLKCFSSKETVHLGYWVRRQGYLEDWSALGWHAVFALQLILNYQMGIILIAWK